MVDLTVITQLALTLQAKPWLGEIYSSQQPELFDRVIALAASPFFKWQPFGTDQTLQRGLLACSSRNKWAIAGNRAGKTVSGLMEDVADCLQLSCITKLSSDKFPHPPKIWIVSDTEGTAVGIVERTLVDSVLGEDQSGYLWNLVDDTCKYTPKSGFSDHFIRFTNGATIEVKFSTQDRKVFQGQACDKIHFDEVQPKDIYSECQARLVDRNGYFLGTMTPVFDRKHGIPWIWEDLYLRREDKGIDFFQWSMLDNPYLSQEAKDRLVREWDEDEKEARIYGSFTPIGVSLAWNPRLLTRIKQGLIPPTLGQFELNSQGKPTFIPRSA